MIRRALECDQPQSSASSSSIVAGPSKVTSSELTNKYAAVEANIEKVFKEVSDLNRKLSESTALVQDMTHKNQELEDDLKKAVQALESSKTTIQQMDLDKKRDGREAWRKRRKDFATK